MKFAKPKHPFSLSFWSTGSLVFEEAIDIEASAVPSQLCLADELRLCFLPVHQVLQVLIHSTPVLAQGEIHSNTASAVAALSLA